MCSSQSPASENNPLRQGLGLTLVELLVAITLMGLLTVMAGPAFSVLVQRYQTDLAASQMVTTLNLARVEGIRRGGGVVVQRLEDGACNRTEALQDWSCGWMVFADRDGDGLFGPGGHPGQAVADQLIQVFRVSDGTRVMRSQKLRSFSVNRWGQLGGVNLGFSFMPPNQRLDSSYQVCSATGGRVRKLATAVSCSGS